MDVDQNRVFRKGSNPLMQSARGKLQNQRQRLNEKINKELRMRTGAENLLKATENNRKLRDRVGIELSYFNSNIQLLKEQLSEMNSSIEVYQHDNSGKHTPMIPLGLKETTSLNFSVAFKDEILEHYSEEGEKYSTEIEDLYNLREAVRTPERSYAGIELLMEYLNQLKYVSSRFFSYKRSLPIHFQWYDCVSGVPGTQKLIDFEEGSIIFNIGSLYTQIACKQDRTVKEGIVQIIVNFEKAAGSFQCLQDHLNNAPSQDMQHETLSMFISLMLAQAQECVLEGRLITGAKESIFDCMEIAQECAMVSQKYNEAYMKMSSEHTKSYLPFTWLSMIETKHYFYKGLAHYYVARALLDQKESTMKLTDIISTVHSELPSHDETNEHKLPCTEDERNSFGRAHLTEALVNHEESLRIHDLCRHLRTIDTFKDILQKTYERTLNRSRALEDEGEFSELIAVPEITAKSKHSSIPVKPDFSKVKVVDIFTNLGPINVFNAQNDWSAPRVVVLNRQPTEGFGFSIKGDSPVVITDVEDNSLAMRNGVRTGDYIVGIGSVNTKWAKHEEVVKLVRQSNLSLTLVLVTPASKPVQETDTVSSTSSAPSTPASGKKRSQKSSNDQGKKNQNRFSAPWLFIRRSSSKNKNGAPSRPVTIISSTTNENVKYASNGDLRSNRLVNGIGSDVQL